MGHHMIHEIDEFSVPEYFAPVIGVMEAVGEGDLIRIVRGFRRKGRFIPVVSLIFPASQMIKEGPTMRAMCERILGKDMMALPRH